jgi:hypothetical protein
MKRYPGFTAEDIEVLRRLGPRLEKYFPKEFERFYSQIFTFSTTQSSLHRKVPFRFGFGPPTNRRMIAPRPWPGWKRGSAFHGTSERPLSRSLFN